MTVEPDFSGRPSQRCAAKAERASHVLAASYTPDPWPNPDPTRQTAQLIEDLYHLADATGADLDYAMAQGRRHYLAEVEAETVQIDNGLGLDLHKCRGCGDRVDEARRWYETCARCQADEAPRRRTWTVTIAGEERYDGEAPYVYLALAYSPGEAVLRAKLAHVIDQECSDMVVNSVDEGAPDPLAGLNDLRDRAELYGPDEQ